jgi:glycine dehydrogenase subunit 1
MKDLKKKLSNKVAGVFIQNPTYLGSIEMQAKEIGSLAKKNGSDFIVWVDPISLGVMEAPGKYGASIVVGNLQSVGIHMNAGGGVGGFIAVKDKIEYINSFKDMLFGYTPTSEPGEFSVSYYTSWDRTMYGRREQGVEFTGTNAALYAILAGVYIASMGPKGMAEVGQTILQRSQYAQKKIAEIPGVKIAFGGASFKEFVVNFDMTGKTVKRINDELLRSDIFGGKDISTEFPVLGQSAVYCVTEAHTKADIDRLVYMLAAAVSV